MPSDESQSTAPGPVAAAGGVVVGYDGSAGAEDALRWAAWDARARRSVLTVCLVQEQPYPAAPAPAEPARRRGEKALAPGLRLARELAAGGEVIPLLAAGPPAAALCARSAAAEVVVLGSRGRDGMPGIPLGPVSMQVAVRAASPVVVVRGHWQPVPGRAPRPVAVGVDGSPGSEAAARFAFREAELRGTWLLAVCALTDDRGVLGAGRQVREDFEEVLSRSSQGCPGVPVRHAVSEGTGREALLEAAAGAQLVAVGARGRGGMPGMLLGGVSLAVLAYASSPVAVVRPRQ